MRTAFGYAWGKLYLAVLAMATGTAPLPERVSTAFRTYLANLNSHNMPPQAYERLRVIRGRLAQMIENEVDEDATIEIVPLTIRDATLVAEEIVSIYDEIAKTHASAR